MAAKTGADGRHNIKRFVLLGTILTLGAISTACVQPQSWQNPHPPHTYDHAAHEFALHEAANNGDKGAIDEFVRRIWPPELRPKLYSVMWCESRNNPRASNGAHGGLLQVQFGTHDGKYFGLGYPDVWWWSVEANLWVGKVIYDQGGWAPWVCA